MSARRWVQIAVAAVLPIGAMASGCGDDDPGTGTGGNGTTVGPGGAGGDGLTGNQGGGGATGGGGMGGVGGAPPVVAEDTCPGQLTVLGAGESFAEQASNTDSSDDYESVCTAGASENDNVYAFDFAIEGTLTISALGVNGGSNPAIYLQSVCGEDTFPAYCYPGSTSAKKLEITQGTWYLIVDSTGDYTIDVRLDAPTCGDGVVNPGEDCDNGPGVPEDGCVDPGDPNECTFGDLNPDFDVCPGESVPVGLGETWLLGHFNTGYTDQNESNVCGNFDGFDRVYTMTPSASGTLRVEVGLDELGNVICAQDLNSPWCWDHVLYARTTCLPGQGNPTEIQCDDVINDGTEGAEALEFPVVGGTPYFVFVDGYDDSGLSFGPYNLRITLTPP